ncbi:hypothetical protein DRP04_06905, partial [Archaeoglobales archaeon]
MRCGTRSLVASAELLTLLAPLMVCSVAGEEIDVGVLVDLSGPLTTYGENIKYAVTLAEDDINRYFEEHNKPYRVNFYFEDTRVDPNIALDKIRSLHSRGVKLFIGPMGSGEIANIMDYVISKKLIVISPSSTAPPKLLGITTPKEKKYVFRFIPPDYLQTKAIAKLASELGVKSVVITYIGNAWGKGLEEYGRAEFEKAGIAVRSSVEYPDPPPADFTPYIATLENYVNELMDTYSADEIAVVTFSYEEVATMLAQVKDDSVLLKINWIGCDGTAKSSRVMEEVPEKASKVGLYSTIFEYEADEEFKKRFSERFGVEPYVYSLNAYDAAWVLALTYAEVYGRSGRFDVYEIADQIPEVTEKFSLGYYGINSASGYIKLDEFNDRASGEYAVYHVSGYSWKKFKTINLETSDKTFILPVETITPIVPQAQLIAEIDDGRIVVTHAGGDSIKLENIKAIVNGETALISPRTGTLSAGQSF